MRLQHVAAVRPGRAAIHPECALAPVKSDRSKAYGHAGATAK
jgi:hypothetical protein